jgi:hypothetical protein
MGGETGSAWPQVLWTPLNLGRNCVRSGGLGKKPGRQTGSGFGYRLIGVGCRDPLSYCIRQAVWLSQGQGSNVSAARLVVLVHLNRTARV